MKAKRPVTFLLALVLYVVSGLPASAYAGPDYSIQIGSTSSEQEARAEVSRLLQQGQISYYVKANIPGKGVYYHIRVGRFATQEAARTLAEEMRRSNLISEFLVSGFEAPDTATVTDASHIEPAKTKDSNIYSSGPGVTSPAVIVQRRSEPRIKLYPHSIRNLTFDETITAITVIDQGIAGAEISGLHTVKLTGLAQGETIVIVSGDGQRRTFAVEVSPPPGKTASQMAEEAARRERAGHSSGSYGLYFSPSFGGIPGLVRQKYYYSQKLDGDRTLHIDGELFKSIGGGERGAVFSKAMSFGMDRIALGVDSPSGTLDILDSQLIISPLSFYGYTMRGVHLTSTLGSRLHGLEVFGGIARPSPAFFEINEGYVGGAIMPIVRGSSWQVRAGLFAIAPLRKAGGEGGGIILQSDARYAPDNNTDAEAEMAYASGGLSWRARLDLRRGPFNLFGETLRLDRRSPLISVGAQPGGRRLNSLTLRWMPTNRFAGSVGYNHTTTISPISGERVALNNSTLLASAAYNISSGSHVSLQIVQQRLETSSAPSSIPFQMETRSAVLNYNSLFGKRWSNSLEARIISSREARVGAQMEQGFSLRNELQRSWEHLSATGYFDYTRNTPSLTSLIVQNPSLLPPLLRRAYEADPVRFLGTNSDLLSSMLPGVVLPETRSTNAGVRFQGAFSRYTLGGDVRYGGGEVFAREQRELATTLSMSVHLNASNSIQVTGGRAFAEANTAASACLLAFSYTHRFGASAGGGFGFAHLLGLDRGHIEGNVFSDLNTNGHQDAREPGVAGVNVRLDGGHTVTTDERGHFSFGAISAGMYTVSIFTTDLGVRLRATTETERNVSVSARKTVNVDFGVTNFGFVSGRIFNDLLLTGEEGAVNPPGVSGVRVVLRSTQGDMATLTYTVDASGMYEFKNLTPGSYNLELDSETLPPDFQLPKQISWTITVEPVRGSYLDIPLVAQRVATGFVFIDKDRDGQFDPQKDEPVAGARVVAGRASTVTDRNGAYLLRYLPAGNVEINAYPPHREAGRTITIKLGAEPVLVRAINFSMDR